MNTANSKTTRDIYPVPIGSREHERFWEAVHQFAKSVGGTPEHTGVNVARQKAVIKIEDALYRLMNAPRK